MNCCFRFSRSVRHPSLIALVALALSAPVAFGQEGGGELDRDAEVKAFAEAVLQSDPSDLSQEDSVVPATVRFSFERSPWRDVIRWIAEEAGLALHVNDLPTGSFTYSDPSVFTHQEAIDRINLFLLPEGYTLVQSGQLLSVINLGDPRSLQQLDAMATMISIDELQSRGDHDVVKCMFPLGEIDAEEAIQELSVLKLMSNPEVLSKTNQLMLIDTVAKLRNVKAILDAFQPSSMDNGTVVKSFALKYADAEDVLTVARPHLGLAVGEMIGIDVSLSADVHGKNIFVTGVEDKVALLEGLVAAIDQPDPSQMENGAAPILQAHLVEGGNVDMVYNVLQTLLAGKSVRLSMDETASSVVALAPPSVQEEIAETVAELQASEAEFEVIPLKSADPFFVISLLDQMLDLPDEFDDPDEIDPDAPKIDADPAGMRLFVRAKRPQIDQIKKIVQGLDRGADQESTHRIRMLPLRGKQAERVLETGAKFWRQDNPIFLYDSSEDSQQIDTERVAGDDDDLRLTSDIRPASDFRNHRLLTRSSDSRAPAIRCELTPRGLIVESDDPEALDQFEQHLITISGPIDSTPSPPIVFYLKYTKAVDALRMLAELLDGGDAASIGEMGSLVNGYVSSSTSLLGSIVTARDGTATLIAGNMTIVAEPRLNRLITQGPAGDIQRVEDYLKIIDKDNSITSIETYGTSHVIELYHTRASEVAQAIRDAYAGRVAASSTTTAANNAGGQPQPKREEGQDKRDEKNDQSKKSTARKPSGNQPSRDLEPKMTVAVHEPSNSLIVTAPDQLFREVEQLAKTIDNRAAQTLEIVTPVNGAVFETLLQQVLLGENENTGTFRPSSRPESGRNSADRSDSKSSPFRRDR